MFESVSFARDGIIGGSVDFGQLAEALVFYQEVHFLADQETFAALVRTCGADVVLELCQMGNLKIHYSENTTAVEPTTFVHRSKDTGLSQLKRKAKTF